MLYIERATVHPIRGTYAVAAESSPGVGEIGHIQRKREWWSRAVAKEADRRQLQLRRLGLRGRALRHLVHLLAARRDARENRAEEAPTGLTCIWSN